MSKIGLNAVILYATFMALYIVIIPYEEQPDYLYRIPEYVKVLDSMDLFFFSNIMPPESRVLLSTKNCEFVHDPYQFFGQMDFESCVSDLTISFKRILMTLIIYLPLLSFILFKKHYPYLREWHRNPQKFRFKPHSFALTLTFPAFIYYSSLYSKEQIGLMLSLFAVYLFFESRWYLFLVSIGAFYLVDPGNCMVALVVILYIWLFNHIYMRFGVKCYLFLVGIVVSIAYFFSTSILYLFGDKFMKVQQILDNIEAYDVSGHYPLLLRPFMTSLSYLFMTPSLSKHLLVYLAFSIGVIIVLLKKEWSILHHPRSIYFNDIIPWISALSVIIGIVFMLPGYNNAKYYIFTAPFLFHFLLGIIRPGRLFNFNLMLNCFVLFGFGLFYTIGEFA